MDEENVILNAQCQSKVKDGEQEKLQNHHPKRVGYKIRICPFYDFTGYLVTGTRTKNRVHRPKLTCITILTAHFYASNFITQYNIYCLSRK